MNQLLNLGIEPGVVWGGYPQRMQGARGDMLQRAGSALRALAGGPRQAPYAAFAKRVDALLQTGGSLPGDVQALRLRQSGCAWDDAALAQGLALGARALESKLGWRPYPTQIMAARILLDGRLAEMATGEGKTVAIALAAAVAALGNTPVHVITANDYLAARDAATMRPFYAALGLSCASVTQPMDQAARRTAWGADIAYCTAKELVFDYLRDGLARPQALGDLEQRAWRLAAKEGAQVPLLRGLCLALVDEADTILIDEAGVPLVLSRADGSAVGQDFLAEAARRAAVMREGVDFELIHGGHQARLLSAGQQQLVDWPNGTLALHNNRRHREDTVALALVAAHGLQRDRDYLVQGGRVILVDGTTGRAAAGRAWSRGLHQLVELKEGCAFTVRNSSVAQITYQQFFPRYLRLGGMSGTVGHSASEMRTVYGLETVAVPTRLPSRRIDWPTVLLPNSTTLWRAVASEVAAVHAQGRPVLVGTDTIAQSEQLSAVLAAAGLPHAVLNARKDADEEALVAAAGQRARITVATSMAGRGTDIALGEGVAALGGLHVVLCQHNPSPRIDRQFSGRAARRGEPGSVRRMLALDFAQFARWLPGSWARVAAGGQLPAWLVRWTVAWPQWCAAYTGLRSRQSLRRADDETQHALIFDREKFS
ncbi:MAG: prepilin peptidase [Ramlibacter sp.]|nr:prepilin peptidase [Ramlibacter sp.]